MGKPGPKPTPTETLKLRGSWLAKTRKGEPEPVAGAPDCPAWIVGESRAEWDRQIVDLDKRRLLSKSYRSALAMFCEAWGEYVGAVEFLAAMGTEGLIHKTDKGNLVQHPMVGVKNKAFERANKLGQQFGFSPSSQTSVRVEGDKEKGNGKSRFFAS